ncbi:MAG: hypothetical protein Q8M01_21880 [Rubrivivax sp.]|nr:hypothetical protein [Rubrivivax sp.]
MSTLRQLLEPLRLAASTFFRHELTLRRGEHGLQLALEPRAAKGAGGRQPSAEQQAAQKAAAELALMREQLRALLSELPETRRTLRALVAVEQALARKGLRALRRLPLDVMRRALHQFEGLVTNWSPVGLANLRSKMSVAIIEREHMDPDAEADAYRTAAVLDTDPDELASDGLQTASDDDELAAAYAALGQFAPSVIEMQPELGSPSARAVTRELQPPAAEQGHIRLRELQH